MEKEILHPMKVIDQIFSKRMETTKELFNDFDKFAEYITPLIDGTEMQQLLKKIGSTIKISLNIDDLVLFTSIHGMFIAKEMMTPKIPLRVECPKCKTLIYDFSSLDEIFKK